MANSPSDGINSSASIFCYKDQQEASIIKVTLLHWVSFSYFMYNNVFLIYDIQSCLMLESFECSGI